MITYIIKARRNYTRNAPFTDCSDLQCLEAHKDLESLLNYTVQPCDDLYAHVCSRWIRDSEKVGFLEGALIEHIKRQHEVLASLAPLPLGKNLQETLEVGKTLFMECLNYMADTTLDLKRDVKYFFKKLHLYRLLNKENSLKMMAAGAKISFKFNLNALLRLRPQRDQLSGMLHASPGVLLQTAFPIEAELEQYIRAVVRATSQVKGFVQLASKIVVLDSYTSNIYSRSRLPFKKIAMKDLPFEPPALVAVTNSSLAKFARMCNLSDMYLFVRNFVMSVTVLNFFANQSLQVSSWYTAVQILTNLLEFDYVKRFTSDTHTAALKACHRSLYDALSPIWSFVTRHMIKHDFVHGAADPVAELFEDVKKALTSDIISDLSGLRNDSTWSRMQETLYRIRIASHRQLANEGDEFTFQCLSPPQTGLGFLKDHVQAREHFRQHATFSPPSLILDATSTVDVETSTIYLEEYGKLFIPAALQTPPVFYHDKDLHFLNFGTLGAIMARELARSIYPSNNSEQQLWTSEATLHYMHQMSCYLVALEAWHGPSQGPTNSTATDWLELLVWLTSVRVAHAALKQHFSIVANGQLSWRAVQRHFFLRFCLVACESQSQTALSARHKCVWPLFNMPEFADAFECPKYSYMASHRSCWKDSDS
ncbi:hypothetical protein HPB48_020372 [Haemaphysalis longicornis]|uniref:Peptidase M13 C-terminal domain-containing protein n=1 Tax=Haemaphysalis longicornis TaxID=44386 RepID=A0A9J6H0S7_HAELO|nr:hypothetical protein HPB48_020372 [Haemaphysalis longicornis]